MSNATPHQRLSNTSREPRDGTARRVPGVRLVLLVACLAANVPTSVGAQAYHIDHYTVDDGLAQNTLRAVVQDQQGFLWVGGRRGLQRFDGRNFVSIAEIDPSAKEDLTALIDYVVRARDGALWVQAHGNLYRVDPAIGRAKRVQLPGKINTAGMLYAADSLGTVWVIVGNQLMAIRDSTLHATPTLTLDWLPRATAVAATPNGELLIATASRPAGHVTRLDPATGATTSYALTALVSPRSLLLEQGVLWVAGASGVEFLAPGTTTGRPIPALRTDDVMQLLANERQEVLVVTDRQLVTVDTSGAVRPRLQSSGLFGVGYLPQAAWSDRDGGLWVATLTAGLFRVDQQQPAFHYLSNRTTPSLPLGSNFVTAMADGADSTVWLTTLRGGAYVLGPDRSIRRALRARGGPGERLTSDEVWDVEVDDQGTAWLATIGGLCAASRDRVQCYGPPSGVVDLARDRAGWLWMASGDRLISFNTATRSFGPVILTHDAAISVFADTVTGLVWSMGGSLGYARPSDHLGGAAVPVTRAESVGEVTYQFERTANGALWIASDRGLWRWDTAPNGHPTLVDIPDLRNATVFSIAEDGSNALWLGTSHGLVHYVPETGASHRFGTRDGVLAGEFTRRAALHRSNGELWFGAVEGLLTFHPERVPVEHDDPVVAFTNVRRVTDAGIHDAPVAGPLHLTLDRHDRALTIDFAALVFGFPSAPRYRFRLTGSRPASWIETREPSVTLTSLPPGSYQLEVQASVGEHAWGEPGARAELDVIPPFWRAVWFELSMVALVTGLLLLLHRLRLQRAIATERLRLRISRDLHDQIGAGLSSIALLSDAARAQTATEEQSRTQLQRIGESARGMVTDLREIVWAIDPSADTLNDLTARLRDLVPTLLPGTIVHFRAPEGHALDAHIAMTARRDLFLLFKELLTNVARHAHATEVWIDVTRDGHDLQLTVRDNGVGFDPARAKSGTGQRSMRERAERLGARFDLESAPGKGTMARVTVHQTQTRRTPVPPSA